MGLYANTVSIRQYQVTGDIPGTSELFDWASSALNGRRFMTIEASSDESSEGWVPTDQPDGVPFETPDQCWRDRYLFMTYRRDQRRIPSAILKSHIRQAEAAFLAERPELLRPPKRQREEIKERVVRSLMGKTLPTPGMVDLCWELDRGIVTVFSGSAVAAERVETLLSKCFSSVNLSPIHPWRRALAVVAGEEREALAALNRAGSTAVLDEIRSNQWLGRELLCWLLEGGLSGASYQVTTPGHVETGTLFNAWIDDRMTLVGGGDGGVQKVVVSGMQDRYLEARSALKAGKDIEVARIHIEKDDLAWSCVLDAETFSFQSLRCPPVALDRGADDQALERESLFLERMYLLESGLQLFDSLLGQFIRCRVGADWNAWSARYNAWLNEDQR